MCDLQPSQKCGELDWIPLLWFSAVCLEWTAHHNEHIV